MPDKAKAEKSLEKYYGELQSQLETMAKEYQTKMQDYEANQATMSNLVKQSKEKEIIDLQTRIISKTINVIVVEDVLCLLQGIFFKGCACFWDIHLTAYILQRQHFDIVA